jgi:hypothetical protein
MATQPVKLEHSVTTLCVCVSFSSSMPAVARCHSDDVVLYATVSMRLTSADTTAGTSNDVYQNWHDHLEHNSVQ